MSFLTKLFDLRDGNPLESPTVPLASLANAPGWLLNWAGGAPTDSGEQVTPLTALASTTIVSCVKLISEGAGQLPLQIIERLDRGTRVAHSPPYFDLLGSEWNDEMTATVGMQVSLVHALLWGTAYIELERDNGNHVIALWPRKPWLVQPKRDKAGKLVYESHDTANNKPVIIDSADMVCIPGLSLDGYVGQNIISTCRQAVGLAIGLERYAARYFGNGGSTSGVVEVPGELSDTAYQRLKTSTDLQMTGANRFRLLFLEGGAKFNTMAATNNEAQMIEARRLVRSELCSMLRCPIHMIASDESKGVKSNTEQISQEFMTFTLNPWLTKYTQAFNSRLFPKAGRTAGKYEVRFHTKALLAADSAARMTYYVQGRNAGILTSNECRIDEGLEPVGPEGDLLMVPLNTIPATQLLIEEGAAHDPK